MQYIPGSDADKGMTQGRVSHPNVLCTKSSPSWPKPSTMPMDANLLHRDVKPAEFLLAPQNTRVLLADFASPEPSMTAPD